MIINNQFFSNLDRYARISIPPGVLVGIAVIEYLYIHSDAAPYEGVRLLLILVLAPLGALLGGAAAYLLTLFVMASAILMA
ncbi:MAG: hypothetical protein P8077_05090, partial [Gammaproteobacteria bacterium]